MSPENEKGRIRPATLSDAEEILAIYAPYIEKTEVSFECRVPTLEAFRERIAGILAVYPYVVYEEDGAILGYAYAHRIFEREAYRFDAELSVYVRSDARGRGIGDRLYRTLIDLCRAMHLHTLYGVITYPNEPSRRLHERLGFRLLARFPNTGYKHGAWRDTVWYDLPDGDYPAVPEEVIPFPALDPAVVNRILEKYCNN